MKVFLFNFVQQWATLGEQAPDGLSTRQRSSAHRRFDSNIQSLPRRDPSHSRIRKGALTESSLSHTTPGESKLTIGWHRPVPDSDERAAQSSIFGKRTEKGAGHAPFVGGMGVSTYYCFQQHFKLQTMRRSKSTPNNTIPTRPTHHEKQTTNPPAHTRGRALPLILHLGATWGSATKI